MLVLLTKEPESRLLWGFFFSNRGVEDGSRVLQLLFSALLLCFLHIVCRMLYRMSVRHSLWIEKFVT